MKRWYICFLGAVFAVLLTSGCEKFGPNRPMGADTGEATKVTPLSAVLSGRARIPGTTMTDLSFGVEYSTDDAFSFENTMVKCASSADADFNYSVVAHNLIPATTYYFRSFIAQNGETSYGKTGSFKTKEISSILKTLEVTEIGAASVTLNGYADMEDCYIINNPFAGPFGFWVEKDGKQLESFGSPVIFVTSTITDRHYSYSLRTDPESNYTVTACLETYQFHPTSTPNAYSSEMVTYFASETVSFRTKPIEASISLDEASEISSTQAKVSGRVSFPQWESNFSSTINIYYSDTAATVEDLKSSGLSGAYLYYSSYRPTDFWGILPNLQPDTQYYWTAVLDVNGVPFETEVKTFRTTE